MYDVALLEKAVPIVNCSVTGHTEFTRENIFVANVLYFGSFERELFIETIEF